MTVTGRPNVGKSTLINQFVGTKVSITTSKPQTTRDSIKGIHDGEKFQIIFIDTPGFQEAQDQLGETLVHRTRREWSEGDLILFLVDTSQEPDHHDKKLAQSLQSFDKEVILVKNKIDKAGSRQDVTVIPNSNWTREIAISAHERTNLTVLHEAILEYLPEGPRLYPGSNNSDRSRKFLISEAIREKAMRVTKQEVPHSIAVVVEDIYPGEDPDLRVVEATIYVERDSQKGILIGEGGSRIKQIGRESRLDLEEQLGTKLYLDLSVKVFEDWTESQKKIDSIKRRKN